jgi:hypothetical protein
MWVLLDDVLGDIHNLSCPVFQLLLLSRLYIAVEDLNGDLQLSPAQMGAHGLDEREFYIGQ